MTVREEIIKTVANTEDSQLLRELLAFLESRKRDPNQPARGSYEAIIRHKGTLSKEDADEMTDIINREFNNIEGEW